MDQQNSCHGSQRNLFPFDKQNEIINSKNPTQYSSFSQPCTTPSQQFAIFEITIHKYIKISTHDFITFLLINPTFFDFILTLT